jgi:hypothetical protein
VLRFMDWLHTNEGSLPPWAQRTTPGHDTQARAGGVAIEYIAGLCNQLGAAPWVTVHHLATDAHVKLLATTLRQQLRPDLQVRRRGGGARGVRGEGGEGSC